MSRRRESSDDAPRVVYYPSAPRAVTMLTPEQAARRNARLRREYEEWARRQNALAERERRSRLRVLGAGAVIGLALLVVLGFGIWWLVNAAGDAAAGQLPSGDSGAVKFILLLVFGAGGITIRVCLHPRH